MAKTLKTDAYDIQVVLDKDRKFVKHIKSIKTPDGGNIINIVKGSVSVTHQIGISTLKLEVFINPEDVKFITDEP